MLILSSVLIGAAVAQDAFAVAAMYGSVDRTKRFRSAVLTAGIFALFQTFMPVLGWSIGKVGSKAVAEYDHIIAFGILSFIGIKMMLDSRSSAVYEKSCASLRLRELITAAFATSVDALTTGITLPAATGAENAAGMILSVLIIGSITFIISLSSYFLGRRIGDLNPRLAMLSGGAVLIAIGIKTLLTAA